MTELGTASPEVDIDLAGDEIYQCRADGIWQWKDGAWVNITMTYGPSIVNEIMNSEYVREMDRQENMLREMRQIAENMKTES